MPSLVFLERDEQLRRRLVRLLTATLPEFSPIGQALDSEQLLSLCRSGPWDVAIVDLMWKHQSCGLGPFVSLSSTISPSFGKCFCVILTTSQACSRLGRPRLRATSTRR